MENEGLTGPVFGSRDKWNGLGVFFDSFDNDAQVLYVYDYDCGIGLLLNQECTYNVNDAIEAHVE